MLADPLADLNLDTQSPAGLLLVRRSGRTFVITFGHAWLKLKDDWLELDFGKRVALHLIPRDQMVEVRAQQIFAKWHTANDRAPQAVSIDEFSVDFSRDLLGAIEGVSSDPAFGKIVRGSTSLKIHITLDQLSGALENAADLFRSPRYRDIWPDVDQIVRVQDSQKQALLEQAFNCALASGEAQKTLILVDPVGKGSYGADVDAYLFGRVSRSPATTPYLSIGNWSSFLDRMQWKPSVAAAKQTPVHLFDEAGQHLKNVAAFDCFGYELCLDSRQYVLASGQWFEAIPEFVARVNQTVASLPQPLVNLPPWNQTEEEREYNSRTASLTGYLNFDAKNLLYGGGQSKLEWCDLVDLQSRTLMFVKIASRSSGISHLVEQARRTVELFFSTDCSYRQKLSSVFAKYYPEVDRSWLMSRPRNGDWNICLVSLGRAAGELPFFARCAVARASRDFAERGHTMSFSVT